MCELTDGCCRLPEAVVEDDNLDFVRHLLVPGPPFLQKREEDGDNDARRLEMGEIARMRLG